MCLAVATFRVDPRTPTMIHRGVAKSRSQHTLDPLNARKISVCYSNSKDMRSSGLSGEALSMFHDAQRNILELNRSRLMALDELKEAKQRIKELEMKCSDFERAIGQMSDNVSKPCEAQQTTIAYSSGWSEAYIHYRRADGSWTDVPGEKMTQDPTQSCLFVCSLDQPAVEFVFNNGGNDWDSPREGGNYHTSEPGEFLVQTGTVNKLS